MGGDGRAGMLGRCARTLAVGRVILGNGTCVPCAAACAASVVGVPLRVDGALKVRCWLFPTTGLRIPASTFVFASLAPLPSDFLKLMR